MSNPRNPSPATDARQPEQGRGPELALASGSTLTVDEKQILADLLELGSAEKAYRRDAGRYGCPYYYEIFTDKLAKIILKTFQSNDQAHA